MPLLIIGAAAAIAWHVSKQRAGVDWEHRHFMLPPGQEVPVFPPPNPGAGRLWYEAPMDRKKIVAPVKEK